MNALNEQLLHKADPKFMEQGFVPMTSICMPTTAAAATHGSIVVDNMSDATAVDLMSSAVPSGPKALSLRGEIFHVFISYRVKSESDLVSGLYHQLTRCAKAAKIPDISRWPSDFKEPAKDVLSSRMHVFWDQKCLAPGLTWKDDDDS